MVTDGSPNTKKFQLRSHSEIVSLLKFQNDFEIMSGWLILKKLNI